MDIRIRIAEGEDQQPALLWDSQWNPAISQSDWVIGGPDDINPLGLQAKHGLHTSVVIALFTWRRANSYDALPNDNADRKGWWGDTIDLQGEETFIGSRLWLLFRGVLNEKVRLLAIDYAREALQPLLKQGVCARIDVTAEMEQVRGLLGLTIRLFSRDGNRIYDQRFDVLWRQEFRR